MFYQMIAVKSGQTDPRDLPLVDTIDRPALIGGVTGMGLLMSALFVIGCMWLAASHNAQASTPAPALDQVCQVCGPLYIVDRQIAHPDTTLVALKIP